MYNLNILTIFLLYYIYIHSIIGSNSGKGLKLWNDDSWVSTVYGLRDNGWEFETLQWASAFGEVNHRDESIDFIFVYFYILLIVNVT